MSKYKGVETEYTAVDDKKKKKNISIYLWYSIHDTFNHSLSLFVSKTPPLAFVSFISISSIVWLAI